MLIPLLTLPLASCVSTGSIEIKPPKLTQADKSLIQDCNLPVDLGNGPLTQAQSEKLWITDRANLVQCYYRHKAHVKYTTLRDSLIQKDSK
jgi:hypothetical protein